jgi:hypothetical protein
MDFGGDGESVAGGGLQFVWLPKDVNIYTSGFEWLQACVTVTAEQFECSRATTTQLSGGIGRTGSWRRPRKP